jgi:hypothetical protein
MQMHMEGNGLTSNAVRVEADDELNDASRMSDPDMPLNWQLTDLMY